MNRCIETIIVGAGQADLATSQIAEELYQSGRRVYLSVGSAGRAPRRYRGRDVFEWLNLSGFMDQTTDRLPSSQARFAGSPQVSGRNGDHSLNLHRFARSGVVLLGRLNGGHDNTIRLASDLAQKLAQTDEFEAEIVKMEDAAFIAEAIENRNRRISHVH